MRISDWSSDVCSSDLADQPLSQQQHRLCLCRARPRWRHEPLRPLLPRLRRQRMGARRPAFGRPAIRGNAISIFAGYGAPGRSEEHTSELQSLMRISYAVFCLKKKKKTNTDDIS